MHLLRWFRKNKTKVLAVVVIVLLFGFIGGGTLLQQIERRGTQYGKTVAHFGDSGKITNYDRTIARRQLQILQMLSADDLLIAQDLHGMLLAELLFPERVRSAQISTGIKRMVRANSYNITDKQIDDIYKAAAPADVYWILLTAEAEQAGFVVSKDQAKNVLERIIPDISGGITYSQLIGRMVQGIRGEAGIAEEEIVGTFAQLLSVLGYAGTICSQEDVTISQTRYDTSTAKETMDVEFVQFNSTIFARDQNEPAEKQMIEHFEKYKKFLAGSANEDNPYGFGYELDDRVRLEYLAVKLDDIKQTVAKPTQQEAQEYYQKHRDMFTEKPSSEANDPNSPRIERTRSYAEVANNISAQLLQGRINSKAEQILQEAKAFADPAVDDTEVLTREELARMAGDYNDAAEQLGRQYGVKIYAGKTGWLTGADVQNDEYLGSLFLLGAGAGNVVGLGRVVFSIDDLGTSELGPFDVQKPQMHRTIGPFRDMAGRITAVFRIIGVAKACEPQGIDEIFDTKRPTFGQAADDVNESTWSVRGKVIEDLKRLAAMETARQKAQELAKLAVEQGWDSAINRFNEAYAGRTDKAGRADANAFELTKLASVPRACLMEIQTFAALSSGRPSAKAMVNRRRNAGAFINHLYSLVPNDSNSVENLPIVVESKSELSYYVIKDISINRINEDQYTQSKAIQAYAETSARSQSLSAVYFNPENILKRMKFTWVESELAPQDANTPAAERSV